MSTPTESDQVHQLSTGAGCSDGDTAEQCGCGCVGCVGDDHCGRGSWGCRVPAAMPVRSALCLA